jgi:hypothetical protein
VHDISEDVREESSENEDEKPPEPTFPPPREIIQGLSILTGPAPLGLFATESSGTNAHAIVSPFCVVRAPAAAVDSSPQRTPFAAAKERFDRLFSKEVEPCGFERM